MKARVTVLLLASLIGCSSAGTRHTESSQSAAVRLLASDNDDESLKTAFERILSSPDARQEFQGYLDRQARIYIRGQGLLGAFDQDLDRAVSEAEAGHSATALGSESYPKLLALRLIGQRERERVTYFYRGLIAIARDKSAENTDRRKLATGALSAFNLSLRALTRSQTEPYKVAAAMDLVQDLMVENLKAAVGNKKNLETAPISELQKISDAQDRVMSWVTQHRQDLLDAARAEEQNHDSISQAVEAMAPAIQAGLQEMQRSPQATTGALCPAGVKLCPSAGKNGNITGLSWPMGTWALTFDDGPSAQLTPKALANLKDPAFGNGMKATFFMLAQNASQQQALVKQVQDAGMAVENHSFTHADLSKASQPTLEHEIFDATDVLTKVFGQAPRFFRCPYGAGMNIQHIRDMIASRNMIHVFWNVDTLDWQDKDPVSIVARARKEMALEKHGVILFHDVHPQSIEASKQLMHYLVSTPGIRTVTIPQFTDEYNAAP